MEASAEPRCDAQLAPKFLADTMLGRLATWLRVLGYDAEYFRGDDERLVARARTEGRVLLTRDTALVRRRGLPQHLFIESDHVKEQVRQVITALGLRPGAIARRCLRCNALLAPRAKAEVLGNVPEYVWAHHEVFWGCPRCKRIYWAGSHQRRMAEAVQALWV